jgi:hypothetical protein
MGFDSMVRSHFAFPDPLEQARAILEIAENIQVARSLVWARLKFARNVDEIHYWCQVEKFLSKRAPSFNLNSPSEEEA